MVMETYYRKRTRKTNQPNLNSQKEAEQVSITAAEFPSLGRLHHVPPPPPSSGHRKTLLKEPEDDGDNRSVQMQNHIEPGHLYEIDHKHLPSRTPAQLRSIRVAMVCEKTELNVSVRYPSKESLIAFFNYSKRETHPALDEKFVMGMSLAEKVLIKLVPAEIYSERKSLETFWMTGSSVSGYLCKNINNNNITVTHKKGVNNYLSEALKKNGMMRWGIRRQVKYLGRHKDIDGVNGENPPSSFVNGCFEGSQMELNATCDDDNDDDEREVSPEKEKNGDAAGKCEEIKDEDMEDDGDDDEDEEINGDDQENEEDEEESGNKNLKRKRYSFRNLGGKKPKKEKIEIKEEKKNKTQKKKKKKKDICSFSEALVLRNPKDRWSAERYKLAEQNLLNVMKAKGATAEKPVLRPQLREEARKKIGDTGLLDHLLKHMAGKLAPGGEKRFRRRHNPDGAMEYWLESADLVDVRKDAGITDPYWVPPPGWQPGDSPTQDPICSREIKLLKDGIIEMEREFRETKMQLEDEVGKLRRELNVLSAATAKRRQEEEENQAITIWSNHSDISQRLDQLATSFDDSSKCDSSSAHLPVEKCKEQLMVIYDFLKEIETKIGKSSVDERRNCKDSSEKVEKQLLNDTRSEKAKSEKAAKIERMKSGFRICKPQGTFLWPDMVKDSSNSSQVTVHVEVPTPSSVNSSTPPQLILVKPLAEKRAVKVTAAVSDNFLEEDDDGANNYHASLFNVAAAARPNITMPLVSAANRSTSPWESGDGIRKVMGIGYHQNSNKIKMGNWLALSTLNSATDESTHGS